MGREYVNRHNRSYSQKRLAALSVMESEEDRIACAILACNYSRIHGDTPPTQSLIQMDCVAACFVEGDIWVASNSMKLESQDIDNAIGADYHGTSVYIVTNGYGTMHAEMQLVEELTRAGKLTKVSYIGVSKPCCNYCRRILDVYQIGYLHFHRDPVRNWEASVLW